MRTSNPFFKSKVYSEFQTAGNLTGQGASEVMTVQGAVNKSYILMACVLGGAAYAWYALVTMGIAFYPMLIASSIIGFILALVTMFMPKYAGYTAPLYGVVEGIFLGVLSTLLETMFPGIVIQAVGLTLGVFFMMLAGYQMGYIRATEQFRSGVIMATGAVFLVYLVSWILRMFGTQIPYIHDGGLIGIGFSLVVVVIASLNLILDFDNFEEGAKDQLPKYMEWYAAFGLLFTLVWLYIEILNLLAKLRGDD
jgi:uncharacterized YccA/Bax inhibitor family protein